MLGAIIKIHLNSVINVGIENNENMKILIKAKSDFYEIYNIRILL